MKLFQALRAKAEARRQAYLKRRQAWIDFFQSDEVKGIALDYFYTRDSRDEPFFGVTLFRTDDSAAVLAYLSGNMKKEDRRAFEEAFVRADPEDEFTLDPDEMRLITGKQVYLTRSDRAAAERNAACLCLFQNNEILTY